MSETEKHNGGMGQVNEEIQRWAAKRRVALIVAILKGETMAQSSRTGPEVTDLG